MPYPMFDVSRLHIEPFANRENLHRLDEMPRLDEPFEPMSNPDICTIARDILRARERGATVLFSMGAHVVKSGLCRFVIDLMRQGYVTHVATNGAGPIHDFELSRFGATSESVPFYIKQGRFGMWRETAELNHAAVEGARDGIGLGEAIGRIIEREQYPNREDSIFAMGYRLRVPVTVHVGIGYDILHEHPNFDAAATGLTSYRDFLIYAHSIENLEGGVFLNFGSAVMGPEVYLKALSMARNVARQEGRTITNFTTAVFDLLPITGDYHEEPPRSDARYYYRPWKTILVRTVADGGRSYYVQGDHRDTIRTLWLRLREHDPRTSG
ncbi:MAG: hypothetical protein HRF45_07165 [Fimbriimonadia bacterium]